MNVKTLTQIFLIFTIFLKTLFFFYKYFYQTVDQSELDQNEFVLKDQDGITSKLLMVCGRNETENLSKTDMNEISRSLANKRLLSLANSYLENLRQEARIIFK